MCQNFPNLSYTRNSNLTQNRLKTQSSLKQTISKENLKKKRIDLAMIWWKQTISKEISIRFFFKFSKAKVIKLLDMAYLFCTNSQALQTSWTHWWNWAMSLPFLPDRSLNPAFEIWYEKDKNLLIWFNSTFSEEVIFTVGVSLSHDL